MSRVGTLLDWVVRSPGRAFMGFALGSLGIALLVLAYIAYTWRNIPGFQTAIDTCARPFCDFTYYYYPMGKAALGSSTPVKGFMYSPFIALLLVLFSPLPVNTAIVLWGILQAGCVVLYLLLYRWLVPAGLRYQMLFVFIALTSFSLWHNLSWGQVGILTTVAVLGMLALLERGRRTSAAALVGFAASFKFFPVIFLAPLAFRRDFRFLLLAALACLAFLAVLPGVVMGPGDTLSFYRGLLESFRNSGWVVGNYNSQHFPHVLLRFSQVLGLASRPYLPLFSIISFSLAALSLVLVYRIQRAQLPLADLWGVHLIFLSLPFFLKTSWPADLVYISFAQAFLVWQLKQGETPHPAGHRKQLSRGVMLALVVISIGLSNLGAFNLIGNHWTYGTLGVIFWADLLCLAVSYILLFPIVRSASLHKLP